MVIQRPPYFSLSDRLDVIASSNYPTAELDDAIAAIVDANDQWDGTQYLPLAVLPSQVTGQPLENLRPEAKEIKAQLVSEQEHDFTNWHPQGQVSSEEGRFAIPTEAAWWSAQVRVLMPKGSVFGDAELGTRIVQETVESLVSPRLLRRLELQAGVELSQDSGWYAISDLTGSYEPPTLVELLARLNLLPYLELE